MGNINITATAWWPSSRWNVRAAASVAEAALPGFPGVGSYLHGGGWPGLLVVVQRSEGFSLPTPLGQTAVCLRSGRCWTLHHEAESRQDIGCTYQIWAYKCTNAFPPLRTELLEETPSECSSVFCSTAVSAAKIFSTGISSFTLRLNSSSPSRSLFLWRSSWTAAPDKTCEDGSEGRNKSNTAAQKTGRSWSFQAVWTTFFHLTNESS